MNKIWNYFQNVKIIKKNDEKIESKLNKTIKDVTSDINNFRYNLAIIKVRDLFNSLPEEASKEVLEKSLKILHPFCPHITEELWSNLGNKTFISLEKWPIADEKKINPVFEKQDQALDKISEDILNILKILIAKGEEKNNVYVYVIPNEKELYDQEIISKRVGKETKVFAVNDKGKYDPTNKSKNSKPGKPAIYIE